MIDWKRPWIGLELLNEKALKSLKFGLLVQEPWQSMPVSCHFRGCKAPLSRIVSGAISSELRLPFTELPSVFRHCWLGDGKGITSVKMLVWWWWWFDCSFAHLIARVKLSPPPPSSLAPVKSRTETFKDQLTQVLWENGQTSITLVTETLTMKMEVVVYFLRFTTWSLTEQNVLNVLDFYVHNSWLIVKRSYTKLVCFTYMH